MKGKSIWEILEIEPTGEKREIRRAYANLAKAHHLEEDPQAFAELNRAYQQALQFAETINIEIINTKTVGAEIVNAEIVNAETVKKQEKSGNEELNEEQEGRDTEKDSLLFRLNQAEQEAVLKSRKEGALYQLITLLEDPKRRKKSDCWREYFLSETFLNEQFDERFGKGLVQYLQEQYPAEPSSEEYLPLRPFILELAIAYALIPDVDGRVNMEGSFFNRVIAGQVWNVCSSQWNIPNPFDGVELNIKDFRIRDDDERIETSRRSGPVCLLMKPENLVRLRSFSDYFNLRKMNRQGYLTEKERDIWEPIVILGRYNHFYEQNGRREVYSETRSREILALYTHWVSTEDVPLCVCKFMYQEYDLKNLNHSSNQHLYQPLKLAILQRFPDIEEELFGLGSKDQIIRQWYQELMKIISDYHSCYDRREYRETQDILSRIDELFRRREWEIICHEQDLLEKMHTQLARRKVMPPALAKRLCAFYQEEYPWPNPQQVKEIEEGLIVSLSFHRMLLETDYRRPYYYQKTEIGDIDRTNRDFWEYFLMAGYGCRSYTVVSSSQCQAKYAYGNELFLPAYLQEIYLPSMEWRKRFVGFDEEENAVLSPKSMSFFLPHGQCFRVEFHLHYVRYFLDEVPVIYPIFTFPELKKMLSKKMLSEGEATRENFISQEVDISQEDPISQKAAISQEQFFFLLAVTSIEDEEREEAEEEILARLNYLPLAPATLPILAKMLAADNARSPLPENKARCIQAVFYEEQERFCFKAEVLMRGIKVYRWTLFGWEEMELLAGEGKAAKALDLEEKKQFAIEKLYRMRQPKPVLLRSYSLEGLDNVAKMRQIINALKEQEQYRKKSSRSHPYTPGWPWPPEKITPAVRRFFAEDGGWMLESYVILQMGAEKKPCFERIFYSKMNIFGFDLFFQSPEFSESLNSRSGALAEKIREKHLIVGHFGWGKSYEARMSFAPKPFAVGESGTFYAYDFWRLYKADTLEELMAKCFDFSEVSRVDIYAGRLSVSRLDHELEYCYTEEDFQNYLDSKTKTLPDVFTKFGI